MVQRLHRYYADSLEKVLSCVDTISKEYQEEEIAGHLWFRGHEYTHFTLTPNIFRGAEYKYNFQKTYSNNHLREHYRYQHFMARNFDKTDYRQPRSVFEWQEIMQHFFSKTRLMDWSESLFSGLEFALEAFLIPYKDSEITRRRRSMQPALWILNPKELNEQVYDSLLEINFDLLKKMFGNIDDTNIVNIRNELESHKDIYFSSKERGERNYEGIVSLTALEDLRRSYAGHEEEAVVSGELNPFFYILLRIYSDGIPVDCGTVPPLAIIHPHHSQRIRAQKGVFTVFPYYIPGEFEKKIQKLGVGFNPMVMEYMPKCQNSLYEIRLTNPQKIAEQMRKIGFKSSDLYPDSQRTTQDMENLDFSL